MKSYESFDDYWEDQSPRNRAIISALRRFVKRVAPKLSEAVKWGNGQFGFFNGSSLQDPKGLLEGEGKYVRHIKVRDVSGIDRQAFAALFRQAAGT